MGKNIRPLGQVAYEAYQESLGLKTNYKDLKEDIKIALKDAAVAIIVEGYNRSKRFDKVREIDDYLEKQSRIV